jgi:hypothetical protein
MTVYQYALSSISGLGHGSGTISVSAASKSVVGSSTTFTTQLAVGSVIISDGQTLAVAAITDNTHLTLQSETGAAISSKAFDYYNLTNVETLTPTRPFAPKSAPKPWFQSSDLGDGTARGMGRPVTSWQFGFVTQAFRNALRAYCPGKSARLFVRSREIDNSDDFITYSGVMLWPDQEQRDSTRRTQFNIEFRDLVQL